MLKAEVTGVPDVDQMMAMATERMRSFDGQTVCCLVLDADYRHKLAENIDCKDAQKLLRDYDGDAELLFLSGFLMAETAPAILLSFPNKTIDALRVLVSGFKTAMQESKAAKALARVAWIALTADVEVMENFKTVAVEFHEEREQERADNVRAEMEKLAQQEDTFSIEANRDAPDFPQDLIDNVIAHMRQMAESDFFCMVVETAAAIGLSKRFPCMDACRQLSEYKGNAAYLILMGKLLDMQANVVMSAIEQDTYEHVSLAIGAVNNVMAQEGLTQAVWLTVSRRPDLIRYFEQYLGEDGSTMTRDLPPTSEGQTLH